MRVHELRQWEKMHCRQQESQLKDFSERFTVRPLHECVFLQPRFRCKGEGAEQRELDLTGLVAFVKAIMKT